MYSLARDARNTAAPPSYPAAELDRIVSPIALYPDPLLAQVLGPFAPHMAEELWISLGNDESTVQTPWPGVSLEQIAA